MYARGLRSLGILTAVAATAAFSLIFFYAPTESDQGFVQKIFYLHVPLAIVSLCGFMAGGALALKYLRSGDRVWDMRSYVAIHLAIVFAVAVLATGSIWARASWGHWWVWNEPVLVSFLIVFLLYCCYQPLRFAIQDPDRQARYAAVFAVVAGAFVPLNFIAVRLAQAYTHPRVFTVAGGRLPGAMRLTFLVSLASVALIYITLWKLELTAKRTAAGLRTLSPELDDELRPELSPRAPAAVVTAPDVAGMAPGMSGAD